MAYPFLNKNLSKKDANHRLQNDDMLSSAGKARKFQSSTALMFSYGLGTLNPESSKQLSPQIAIPAVLNTNVFDLNQKRNQSNKEAEANRNKSTPTPENSNSHTCKRCNRKGHSAASCVQPRSYREGPQI